MTIDEKKRYFFMKYGIEICYDDRDYDHYTRSGGIDHRYIRYKISYPVVRNGEISFMNRQDVEQNVCSYEISKLIKNYFRKHPGTKELFEDAMAKVLKDAEGNAE